MIPSRGMHSRTWATRCGGKIGEAGVLGQLAGVVELGLVIGEDVVEIPVAVGRQVFLDLPGPRCRYRR